MYTQSKPDAMLSYLERNGPEHGIHIKRKSSSAFPDDSCGTPCYDRLSLAVDYCFSTFPCEVILDPIGEFAPDFVLDSANGFSPNLDELGLGNWDPTDHNGLIVAIHIIREAYAEYERRLLQELCIDRVNFDFDCMSHVEGTQSRVVPAGQPTMVVFSIPINVMVAGDERSLVSLDVLLKVQYHISTMSTGTVVETIESEIVFSDVWKDKATFFQIPQMDKSQSLVDYRNDVESELRRGLTQHIRYFTTREQFVRALLLEFTCCVLDYDTVEFSHLTLFVEMDGVSKGQQGDNNTYLVIVTLPAEYPRKSPTVSMLSPVFYETNSSDGYKPYERKYQLSSGGGWPWAVDEIGKKFCRRLEKEASTIK